MNLKYGKKGDQVAQLQKLLNAHGYPIAVDGDFGAKTEQAVVAYQTAKGLIADGIVGDKTWASLQGQAVAHLIKPSDYDNAAERLGVPVAVIRAFAAVESAGGGFIEPNKPKILFERHVMYRHIKAKFGVAVANKHAQAKPNLVNTKTGGYQGGRSEWVRLGMARTIDDGCALMSASWGAFQIMGENWQALGYESVQDFVAKMCESESHQLDAFVRFIETKKGLKEALQKGDWDKVFMLYNGKAYKKLGYDVKFTRELRRLEMLGK